MLASLVSLISVGAARGQTASPPYFDVAFPWDSGVVSSTSSKLEVVAQTTVRVQGAAWLQLHFKTVALDGDVLGPSRAIVRITSHFDGGAQQLDADAARQWRYSSAYFNGDTVELEVLASRSQGRSRVELRSVSAGPLQGPLFLVCGATDDRVLSNDPRAARTMPIGCTAFLINDCMHSFLTAGHCGGMIPATALAIMEFNVPPSLPNGTIQHPPPEDQYATDPASFQLEYLPQLINDWCYFGCFPNPNTGLTAYQTQGAQFQLAPVLPPFDPSYQLRVTGFGGGDLDAEYLVQKTAAGPYNSTQGSVLHHEVDTVAGESGAALEWDNGGGVVVGIHTSGGCTSTSGFNYATAIDHPHLVAALAAPLGVCNPTGSANSYCTAKVNSLGCAPVIASTGTPSESAGPGSFTITTSQLINQKTALLYYGYAPLAGPFKGGFKCVAAPTIRTPVQSTGGASSGSSCTGALTYDMGARIASGVDPNLVCGTIVYAQVWSRDPADPFTTNLTAGLRFVIGS